MGYHDSINAIKEKVLDGRIVLRIDNGIATFSGSTYEHREFLKSEYGCRWDREAKSWVSRQLSEPQLNLLGNFKVC